MRSDSPRSNCQMFSSGAHGLMDGRGYIERQIAAQGTVEAGRPKVWRRFSRLERLLNFEMQTIPTAIGARRRGIERIREHLA
ncbi:MAG: hypothetical protein ABI165_11105 [Bryobacteraceae bacterium]